MAGELDGLLVDLLRALDKEIEATKAASDLKALRGTDGQLLAATPDGFLYSFQLQGEVLLPAETSVLVEFEGVRARGALERIEGFALYVLLDIDLGSPLPEVTLRFDATFLAERLKEVLAGYLAGAQDFNRHLVEQVMGFSNPHRTAWLRPADNPPAGDLNASQERVVAEAQAKSLLFVWGPPGTGKSHTLGALAGELVRRGERVLVTSHTNVAVDNALARTWRWVEGTGLEGANAIVRVGPSQDLPPDLAERIESRRLAEAQMPPPLRPSALRDLRKGTLREWDGIVERGRAAGPSVEDLEAVVERFRAALAAASALLKKLAEPPADEA
jgi:hypothetical protein